MGTPARMLFVTIAMVCIIIAGPVTHGLAGTQHARSLKAVRTASPVLTLPSPAAGRLKHQKSGEWRFFQPWRGGVAFVAAQGLGWALYSISLVAFFVAFWCVHAITPIRVRAHPACDAAALRCAAHALP